MKYNNISPFFPKEDVENILSEVKNMLSGEAMLTQGPKVKAFENAYAEYTGTKYAISTNSCTSALEIVLASIEIGKGDEVIVPSQTFIATGSSIIKMGGNVVYCDTNDNFLIDFEDLKRKITRKTKAVIIVHFCGLIHTEIFKIKSYLKAKNIFLIEDNAHASGAKINDRMSGSIGEFGCHSFFSSKIITTGEGGMITTNDDKLSKICRSIRSRGLDIDSDIEIFNRLGSNYKMPEYESILGISQLRRLESFVEHRMKIANIYKEELKGLSEKGQIRFQKVGKNIRHPYWKFIIFITRNHPSMKDLGEAMKKSGINIGAPYSPLLHLQPIMKAMTNSREGDLPKSEALSKTHFCLPIHLNISESDARKIASLLITILTND